MGLSPYYKDDLVTIYHGDCREILPSIRGVSAVVTDSPYELGFMGKKWDNQGISFQAGTWRLILESCLPGASLLSFGGTRTSHRLACAIEDAGWEIRDTIMWVYGCLSEDTEILTRRGYMPYHKLTKCDIIVVYDAENDIYKWEAPQRWQVYRVHEDTIYRIRSDNTDQIVSRNHNCLVDREGALLFTKAEALASMENMPILPDDFPNEFALQGDILLPPVQRDGAWSGMENLCSHRQGKLESRKRASTQGTDDWQEEPCMERWSNLFQDTRQLCGSEIYSLSSRILNDGSEGRLCNGASSIGSPTNRATFVTDRGSPPRQSQPDRQQSNDDDICQQQRTQAIRSGASYKTTLARIYPERYSGIIYCPTVSTGAFVARRNGKIFITGNSGFPKSLDISKAIDKQRGAKRTEYLKPIAYPDSDCWGTPNKNIRGNTFGVVSVDAKGKGKGIGIGGMTKDSLAATPEAKLWEGYGTGLKPSYEPIILAMKPLDGTFANNALKHKVAGLNIDECRIPSQNNEHFRGIVDNRVKDNTGEFKSTSGFHKIIRATDSPLGRFPANFIHDGSQEVMELFPQTKPSRQNKISDNRENKGNSMFLDGVRCPENSYNDSGSAARFFYTAKASWRERDAGLEDMPDGIGGGMQGTLDQKLLTGSGNIRNNIMKNTHPTVKPLSLMTYLCKLVNMPEYNLILDPFCGSGSTLLACKKLGIPSIGIESSEEYCEIASKRCANAL